MVMPEIKRMGWFLFGCLALGVLPSTVMAQTPDDASQTPQVAPERMLEDALNKIESGSLREADALIRKVKVFKPTLDKLKLAEGLLLRENKARHVEAITLLAEYNKTEEGRTDYRGFLAIGAIYRESLMFREAIPALERAKNLAPIELNGRRLRAEAAIDLAVAYRSLDRKEQAIEAAREAQRLAPDDPGVQLKLAQIAFATEDYATATKGVDRAIEQVLPLQKRDPLRRLHYDVLLSCYQLKINLGRHELAVKSESPAAYYGLGVAARNLAEVSKLYALLDARDSVGQALAKEPENPQYLLFAARLEAELGATGDALEKIELILKTSPENRDAKDLREQIQSGVGGFIPR